jgi:lipid II:glycine glycyltransferase (peptidoglycan interpeptide bridge formation enzyme)
LSVSIQNITTATRDKWLSFAQVCPHATYFHTPYWYEQTAPKQKHIALEITFNDDASAVIPLVKSKRLGGLLTGYYSSPYGTYGGWISESKLNNDHADALLSILLSKKNLVFRVNPFDPLSSGIPEILKSSKNLKPASYKLTDDFTQILDLTCNTKDIFCKSSDSFRRGVNKAEKHGIVIKQAQSWKEWEQYYCLYKNSLDRWRGSGLKTRTIYTLDFFRRLYDNHTGHETLWLAFKDERALSGALCFYWNRHAVYWHGAADSRYFNCRPNNLLFREIVLDAARQGYEIFDFNPSGGYGGVESFKKHAGAHILASPVLTTITPLRSLISRVRARVTP